MANPLKLLKLKPTGFQFIQEVPIKAPPGKVWKTVLEVSKWFWFTETSGPKQKMEAWPGGRLYWEGKEGSGLFATVTQVEPGKLLRLSGQMGLNHLPVTSAVIFELQPRKDGKATLLRLGHRAYGFMDADVKKRYSGGWKQLLGQLRTVAERK